MSRWQQGFTNKTIGEIIWQATKLTIWTTLNLQQNKTVDSLRIELNTHSRAILKKYAPFEFPNGNALPVVSNQKMNTYLHELCKLAGFDEPIRITYYLGNERFDEIKPKYIVIGTHTGRRSFICNALGMGISPQVVMKWTGHSDYKAMKLYIDVADEIKAEAMKKFDDFWLDKKTKKRQIQLNLPLFSFYTVLY